MVKILKIKLGKGDLENGFNHVIIELESKYGTLSLVSSLASATDTKVIECYQEWKSSHQEFYKSLSHRAANQQIEFEQPNSNVQPSKITFQYQKLKDAINDWLHTRDFCAKEKQIRTALGQEDKIMVIISTEDAFAWRLPWHLWSFFDDYRNAGVVLSTSEFKKVNSNNNDFSRPKVLAIVDNRQNKNDLESWTKTKNINLNVLSGDELSNQNLLQKISDELYEQSYNILFFAGHSSSDINNGSPSFFIKPNEPLSIKQLENALSEAIKKGLQLAIFNSCDGLGIARDLLTFNLPKVVVMREDVPNKVAEEFLKYFLEEFIKKKGTPAFLAVRRARERLQGLEDQFPSASLLPVMCSNPATKPLVIYRKSKWLFRYAKNWFAKLKTYFLQGFQTFRHPSNR
ncbi:hypothetical protein DP113_05645 [Brasilonema octagenarum UFV-E1]|uniref:CHAT domain-containing protein n=2 Tax=Brasilonema TaxID=383614 RepID=A0A856M9M6_9CYAN|nr:MULTISPECIES: CHAT domain-containing protein [Brasilonema]NMF66128.1 hypothetical protein [Brasilonema octagenarum UFV-OR1]QDL07458.1 hypothetical protein DP114_05690 [Brasilonema sennae CENA114]QDL13820.1 hypothetical protein DP113_05645 [Brasilonema octagenarum UFV-E1]